jgi:hypothetical protein
MKLAEYHAKIASVVEENGSKKLIVHATDGTKVIISLGEWQADIVERDFLEAPCA